MALLSLQNDWVLRQLVQEREAVLHRTNHFVIGRAPHGRVRRWVGRQLVCFGTRLATEPTMRPARAR